MSPSAAIRGDCIWSSAAAVSFAESIDTVASTSARSRRPSSSACPASTKSCSRTSCSGSARAGGCGRRSTRPAWPGAASCRTGGRTGPPSWLDRLGLRAALCAAVPQHPAPSRARPQPAPRSARGASISPETLRFFDIDRPAGVAGLRPHRIRRRRLHPDRKPSPARRLRPAPAATPNGSSADDGEILLRNPGVFKGYFLDEKASTAIARAGGWLRTGDIVEVHGQWRDHRGRPQEGDHHHRRRQEHRAVGDRERAEGQPSSSRKPSWSARPGNILGAIIQVDFDNVGRWARDKAPALHQLQVAVAAPRSASSWSSASWTRPTSALRASRTSAASPSSKRSSTTTTAS